MKHYKTTERLVFFICLLVIAGSVKAQDPHFAAVQEINIWTNPSLKTDKVPMAQANYRTVNYPNIISYTSKAAMIELPLIGINKDRDDVIPFANLTIGINTEVSKDQFMNVSSLMMAFSYALPLNDDDTYISAGFQGHYTFSRVGLGGTEYFPSQFDKYGSLASAIANDPYQSGLTYHYFTAGVGASVFHSGDERQWYIGGSIQHFNHPYTEWNHDAQLASNIGIQAGYTTAVSDKDAVGVYGNFNWQAALHEKFIGASYTRTLNDSATSKLSAGIGYRFADAVVPNIIFTMGASRFAFYYEINISSVEFNNYHRRAFEFSYRINL